MLDILDLCIPWGSLVLIDEVRGSSPWEERCRALACNESHLDILDHVLCCRRRCCSRDGRRMILSAMVS